MRRCDRCSNGIADVDPAGGKFVICALVPPTPLPIARVVDNQITTEIKWVRPPMLLEGFCGQFKLSWKKLLFPDGART